MNGTESQKDKADKEVSAEIWKLFMLYPFLADQNRTRQDRTSHWVVALASQYQTMTKRHMVGTSESANQGELARSSLVTI